MRNRRAAAIGAALLAGLLIGVLGFAAPTNAAKIGSEGCTPGYWKTHTDNWEEASPFDPFSGPFHTGTSGVLLGITFEDALHLKGGPGVAGAEQILARAAVAGYLNAAHDGLGYPWRRWQEGLDGRPPLVPTVNAALDSGDRATMIELAAWLDADNNLGCPLS